LRTQLHATGRARTHTHTPHTQTFTSARAHAHAHAHAHARAHTHTHPHSRPARGSPRPLNAQKGVPRRKQAQTSSYRGGGTQQGSTPKTQRLARAHLPGGSSTAAQYFAPVACNKPCACLDVCVCVCVCSRRSDRLRRSGPACPKDTALAYGGWDGRVESCRAHNCRVFCKLSQDFAPERVEHMKVCGFHYGIFLKWELGARSSFFA